MGNEHSQLPGIEIEQKAIEVSDFWSQHSAFVLNREAISNSVSVFVGELFINGPLWTSVTPLESSSKNLMIYRHPCILKYISSWQRNSKFYLAVEEALPLSHVLPKLNTLQICIGLHSILKALCFLHETAFVSHNNVCVASIYVTKDGSWKLGGMEYLCQYKDLTSDFLTKSRSNRYNKAIDPNEEKHIKNCKTKKDFIDVFAFGVLANELLKNVSEDVIPTLKAFKEYCRNILQAVNAADRPTLRCILEHEFFNHDFISIHSFLIELPLKSDTEKTHFFLTLYDKLKSFNEEMVAKQLGGLLLSRMVLLNKTAQVEIVPHILCPRQEECDAEHEQPSTRLFTVNTFKQYITPKLLQIFGVRDAQIRLLLLNHFPYFVETFTKEELQSHILPELLVGIKDTNDELVSVTLRILADLVLILGAATVIGGKRAKLFNDGRPIIHIIKRHVPRKDETMMQSEADTVILTDNSEINSTTEEINRESLTLLPERPRPDGEEGETSTEEIEQSLDEDLNNWEDWNNEHEENVSTSNYYEEDLAPTVVESQTNIHQTSQDIIQDNNSAGVTVNENENTKAIIPDITALDIKNQLNGNGRNEEFDFFQDMEPIIKTDNVFLISENKSDIINSEYKEISNKLTAVDDNNEDGWGEEEWE